MPPKRIVEQVLPSRAADHRVQDPPSRRLRHVCVANADQAVVAEEPDDDGFVVGLKASLTEEAPLPSLSDSRIHWDPGLDQFVAGDSLPGDARQPPLGTAESCCDDAPIAEESATTEESLHVRLMGQIYASHAGRHAGSSLPGSFCTPRRVLPCLRALKPVAPDRSPPGSDSLRR